MNEKIKTKNTNTLVRLTWTCPEQGIKRTAWFTTNNKASQFAREEDISDEANFEIVDIPKKKLDLCEWLNNN
jgi:hypothetical protein